MQRHGEKWSEAEERKLYERFILGDSYENLMESHQRKLGGIKSRLTKLGLIGRDGNAVSPTPNFQPNKTKKAKKVAIEAIEETTSRVSNEEVESLKWKCDIKTLHKLGIIGNRLNNCLLKLGYKALSDSYIKSDAFFLSQKNFGWKTLRQLREIEDTYLVSDDNEDIEESPLSEIAKKDSTYWNWSGATSREISDLIYQIISDFPKERVSEVLKLRCGLLDGEGILTLSSIGKIYGVSRERVRQIEASAKNTISNKLEAGDDAKTSDLKIICGALFEENQTAKPQKIIQFCKEFYGVGMAWKIAAFIYVSLRIETDLVKAEKRALDLYREEVREEIGKLKLEKDKSKKNELWQKIYSKAVFPNQLAKFTDFIPSMNKRYRVPNEDSIGAVGTFYSKKTSRHILFESGIEKAVLSLLDSIDDIVWFQEQPTKINYEINGLKKSYYPDIALVNRDHIGLVVEVKPTMNMFLLSTLRKACAAIKFLNEKGVAFVMTDHAGKSICDLAKVEVAEPIEKKLLKLVDDNGVVNWSIYRTQMINSLTLTQFASIVIRKNLSYSRQPFRLSRLNSAEVSFTPFLT